MGKGGKRPVYDFLYSIDYGVCLGPVDSINEVFVKDRRIFCGSAQGRVDVPVNQPDLFGGANGEGGCVGVVEIYDGAADQVASTELASRVGRTPATMPGYRGIAHLFFRGLGGTGFRWTSNNPYLPAAKVNVTRMPKTLSGGVDPVFPFAEYDSLGNPVPVPAFIFASPDMNVMQAWIAATGNPGVPTNAFTTFPVSTYGGFSAPNIDVGRGLVRATMAFTAQHHTGGDPLGFVAYNLAIQFFNGAGQMLGQANSESLSTVTNERITLSLEVEVPPGTRNISIRPTIQPSIVLFTQIVNPTFACSLSFNSGQPVEENPTAHCDTSDVGLAMLPNANPAHVIHECLVDPEWGKGEDPNNIDTESFLAAAATYRAELMGISAIWTREDHIDSFIQEVLNHTNSLFFQSPSTGQWKLKPIRGDYDAAAAPLLDPTNCRARDRKRRAWGEIVNEIVVKYTDPRTEKLVAVAPAHNLSSIAIQGGVISDVREYPMFRDPYIAGVVAAREVRASGYPLFSTTLECDRSFWDTEPGDVVRFSWPEDGISQMVLRVMEVDRGNRRDRTIKLHCVEDVYALEQTVYVVSQQTEWVSDRQPPAALGAEFAMTAPLPALSRNGFTVAEVDSGYPSVGAMLFAASDTTRVIDVEAHAETTLANGSTGVAPIHTFPPSRSVLTEALLSPEAASALPGALVSALTLNSAAPGDLLLLGGSEAAHEIVMLDTYDSGADTWTIARAIWDTLPGTWPAGTRLWRLQITASRFDPIERTAGEALVYRFLPRTSEGRLAYPDAADVAYTATERPHLPFRPANCQLDGAGFGLLNYTATGVPASVTATWANRNRTTEDAVLLRWTEANVTPEVGQTTVLRVLDAAGVAANEITGLTGTSHVLLAADFAGVEFGFIEFLAERDGLRSRVGARRAFDFRQGGYGLNYGNYYGP